MRDLWSAARGGDPATGAAAGDDAETPPEPLLPGGVRGPGAAGGQPVPAVRPDRAAGDDRRDADTRVAGIWSMAYRITQRLVKLKIWP